MSTANASFRNGIFSSFNIQGNVQVFFGLPTLSEDKNDLTLLDICVDFLFRIENCFPEIFPSKASIATD